MKNGKVATVTVTYNRKELLVKNIQAIMNQDYNIDAIIIIDNHSTDNTKETVEQQFHNDKIKYIYLDENTGGAGGFYTGCKYAFENNYDWVVLMDDDGRPQNSDTIKNLMKEIERKKLTAEDLVLINSLVLKDNINLTFGLFSDHDTIESIKLKTGEGIILNKINPFNGTLVSNGLMKKIGFPNKDFFITYDEEDYFYRAENANAYIATILDSLYYHPRNMAKNTIMLHAFGKKINCGVSSSWKTYYVVRNKTYLYKKINKKGLIKYILKRMLDICIVKCKKIETIKMLIKGYVDGKKGKLGKTIEPR